MTQPTNNKDGDVPAVVIMSVAVVCIAAIAGVTLLALQDKNTTVMITIIAALSPFVVSILAVRSNREAIKTRAIAEDVKSTVNGKIDNLITDKTNLEHQVAVAGLTPVTATVAYDPQTNSEAQPVIGLDTTETDPPTNPTPVAELLQRLGQEKKNG